MFHLKSGTRRASLKNLPDHIRINWRYVQYIPAVRYHRPRFLAVNLQMRNKPHNHYGSLCEFYQTWSLKYLATSMIFFLFTRRGVIHLFSLRIRGILYFLYLQNKYDSSTPPFWQSTASVSNSIPRGESNPTCVERRLACNSVAFHRRSPTLISQFRLASVFHDFIVINLCDFSLFTSRAIFLLELWRVTPPRLAATKDSDAGEREDNRWEKARKTKEKRKLVMYFKRSM